MSEGRPKKLKTMPVQGHHHQQRQKLSHLKTLYRHLVVAFTFMVLVACDRITRHKIASTIFDGVPSLPPAEEYCEDYRKKAAVASASKTAPSSGETKTAVMHLPYAEKRCPDCHSKDKDTGDGLVRPKRELCFVCHTNFFTGSFVHGPAAVGDCLACHEPHSSSYPALLTATRNDICSKCHREKRVADAMHARFSEMGMACIECHDPHSGNVRYFLK